jgi:hypothetical protein
MGVAATAGAKALPQPPIETKIIAVMKKGFEQPPPV